MLSWLERPYGRPAHTALALQRAFTFVKALFVKTPASCSISTYSTASKMAGSTRALLLTCPNGCCNTTPGAPLQPNTAGHSSYYILSRSSRKPKLRRENGGPNRWKAEQHYASYSLKNPYSPSTGKLTINAQLVRAPVREAGPYGPRVTKSLRESEGSLFSTQWLKYRQCKRVPFTHKPNFSPSSATSNH